MNRCLLVKGNGLIGIAVRMKLGHQFFQHRSKTDRKLLIGLKFFDRVRVHERSFRRWKADRGSLLCTLTSTPNVDSGALAKRTFHNRGVHIIPLQYHALERPFGGIGIEWCRALEKKLGQPWPMP